MSFCVTHSRVEKQSASPLYFSSPPSPLQQVKLLQPNSKSPRSSRFTRHKEANRSRPQRNWFWVSSLGANWCSRGASWLPWPRHELQARLEGSPKFSQFSCRCNSSPTSKVALRWEISSLIVLNTDLLLISFIPTYPSSEICKMLLPYKMSSSKVSPCGWYFSSVYELDCTLLETRKGTIWCAVRWHGKMAVSFRQDRWGVFISLGSTDHYHLIFKASFFEQLKNIDCFETHTVISVVVRVASLEIKDNAFYI